MSQNADKIVDHFNLFKQPDYQEMFKNKQKMFENRLPAEEVARGQEWKTGKSMFCRSLLLLLTSRAPGSGPIPGC